MTIERILRDYQIDLIDRVRSEIKAGKRAPLVVLPTGGGKTVCFSSIAASAADLGRRVVILVHRAELLMQTSATLQDIGVRHGIVAPGRHRRYAEAVQVASVQSLAARLKRGEPFPRPDLIIIDEAHHTVAGTWARVIEAFPDTKRIGFTATPVRTDGQGLAKAFDAMVEGPNVRRLTERGYLAPAAVFAPGDVDLTGVRTRGGDWHAGDLTGAVDKPSVTGDAVEHYRRHVGDGRALVFCCSLQHAEHVTERFNAAGIPAERIDGALDAAERRRVLRRLASGETRILTSVDLISEGFDVPAVEAAILLRPTQSTGLYLQQVGRALRPAPGKARAVILDHVGNTMRHGLPDEDREWSLHATKRGRRKSSDASDADGPRVVVCGKCFAAHSLPACPHCGFVPEVKPREIAEREGQLIEITPEQIEAARAKIAARVEQGRATSEAALIELATRRGYRNPRAWAHSVLRGREQKQQRQREGAFSW